MAEYCEQQWKTTKKNENAPNRSKQTSNDVSEKNVHARYWVYSDRLFRFARFRLVLSVLLVPSLLPLSPIWFLSTCSLWLTCFRVALRFLALESDSVYGMFFFVVLFGFPNTYILSLNLLYMDCFFLPFSVFIVFVRLFFAVRIVCLFFLYASSSTWIISH